MATRLIESTDVELAEQGGEALARNSVPLAPPRSPVPPAQPWPRYFSEVLSLSPQIACVLLVPILWLVQSDAYGHYREPVRLLNTVNAGPAMLIISPLITYVYYGALRDGAHIATIHSVMIRGRRVLAADQLHAALRIAARPTTGRVVSLVLGVLFVAEFMLLVDRRILAEFGVAHVNIYNWMLLLTFVVLALALFPALSNIRKALIRRERANAGAYFHAQMPLISTVLVFQLCCLLYCIMLSCGAPLIEYAPHAGTDGCDCEAVNEEYVEAFCNETHILAATARGQVNLGHQILHYRVTALECDDGGWGAYRSRFACCADMPEAVRLLTAFKNGATASLAAIFCIALREYVLSVSEGLTWHNWSQRTTPRIQMVAALTCLLALSVPINLVAMVLPLGYSYGLELMLIIAGMAWTLTTVEFLIHKYVNTKGDFVIESSRANSTGGGRHGDGSLRRALDQCIRSLAANGQPGSHDGGRMAGSVNDLVCGKPMDAALGIEYYMKVSRSSMHPRPAETGIEAMVREFELHGTDSDRECVDYILHAPAGSSDKTFDGRLRDCDAHGRVHNARLNAEGRARVRDGQDAPAAEYGMRLHDFVDHASSSTAHLDAAHVFALRIYTTAAFRTINDPLRDTRPDRPPHGLPTTVTCLKEAIGKLRAVEAQEGDQGTVDLWRGMKNLRVVESFTAQGGTELAPMSTSTDLQVAVQYSRSPSSLLLKIRTKSFMQRGADLAFLSAFPGESELLYPPLTFLAPTGRTMEYEQAGMKFTVVEVEPFTG